jgi:hypothetical protein
MLQALLTAASYYSVKLDLAHYNQPCTCLVYCWCAASQLLNVTKVTIGTHEMGPVAFSIVKVTTQNTRNSDTFYCIVLHTWLTYESYTLRVYSNQIDCVIVALYR